MSKAGKSILQGANEALQYAKEENKIQDLEIPGFVPEKETENLLWDTVARVNEYYGTKGGRTALYWSLVYTIHKHIETEKD